MTNEELILRLYGGDESALESLYLQNKAFIRKIAVDAVKAFGLWKNITSSIDCPDGHTLFLLDEATSEGAIAFFRLLRQKKYDQSLGMLTTYLFPHIKGAVYRFFERTLTVQRYDRSIEELATEEDQISFLERYADGTEMPTHIVVYRKICAELLGELFNALPRKDKLILGRAFGAFGFEQAPLDEIALEMVMRVDGVVKARARALAKLREMYAGSRLERWRWAWRVVMNVQ